VDSELLAQKKCPHCGGRGTLSSKRADGSLDWQVCACVVLSQRLRAVEVALQRLFPGRMREMTLGAYQTGDIRQNSMALQVARNFVDNWPVARAEGWMLGFWGPPRAGKTHLATGIAIACLKRYMVRPVIRSVPELLREERRGYSGVGDAAMTPVDEARLADLLILDDLGAEYIRTRTDARSDQDWVDEQLYLILNDRFIHQRPTIYTTNLSPDDMPQRLSQRVYSRIERAEEFPARAVVPVSDAIRPHTRAGELLLRGNAFQPVVAAPREGADPPLRKSEMQQQLVVDPAVAERARRAQEGRGNG